ETTCILSKGLMNEQTITQHYLDDTRASFRAYKKLAEKALAQLRDEEYFVTLDEESNSIAVIMKHMAGNMLSRWTDFLTSDGEKPDRNRDLEFVIETGTTKEELFTYWERGWACLFNALESLQPSDFDKTVFIRGKTHSIVQATHRQMTHYAYHIGQIVFLAKHLRASEWTSLSVPRNRSAAFNEYLNKQPDGIGSDHYLEGAAGFTKSAKE
ncbi:MAG TPA: DUF1572 family protein, partial [Pyrinomonadaceae bacterium]|nr:DUF1572 family protein [Pyrinomonadaceae bacterium]